MGLYEIMSGWFMKILKHYSVRESLKNTIERKILFAIHITDKSRESTIY